jgi:hypothetical protein
VSDPHPRSVIDRFAPDRSSGAPEARVLAALATLSRALQRIAEGDYLDDVDARRVAEEALAAAARTLDAGSAA